MGIELDEYDVGADEAVEIGGKGGRGRQSAWSEEGIGEGEREPGRGIWEGVGGATIQLMREGLFLGLCFASALLATFDLAFAIDFFGVGRVGGESVSTTTSTTCGRPTCGPLRFRIDEKCSQS
jgi:hypothetical protein